MPQATVLNRLTSASVPDASRIGARSEKRRIPLIDLFAGCGGFSEGFLSYARHSNAEHHFDLRLALDNDEPAHQTHLLRAFFHQFDAPPEEYYDFLQQRLTVAELFQAHPTQARAAAERVFLRELGAGPDADEAIHALIEDRVGNSSEWVLIGGPPCQAYSIVGRSRNRGKAGYQPEADPRHFLYREYLKVLARHWPSVFVMENVPGMLNSKVNGERIWHRILQDLVDPVSALGMPGTTTDYDGYRLYSLVTPDRGIDIFGVPTLKPDEYIVRCEQYGVPQARHRVFILGIRSDIDVRPRQLARAGEPVPCGAVLEDLPPVRSGLTCKGDREEKWLTIMRDLVEAKWWTSTADHKDALAEARQALMHLVLPKAGRGGQFVPHHSADQSGMPDHLRGWLFDARIRGVCNHHSKAHMESDLHRYVFAACHTRANHHAPLRLAHFPEELLPAHENVQTADRQRLSHSNFSDRFAVQAMQEPARTIVSHIAKDGHYYIHPDPAQARSLTVREAARLQTFPDNFFFPGAKTEQYRQVGNAVPPFLAYQIAGIIDDVFERGGR